LIILSRRSGLFDPRANRFLVIMASNDVLPIAFHMGPGVKKGGPTGPIKVRGQFWGTIKFIDHREWNAAEIPIGM
jgi:hypothetical protein